jgi:hypothetical protein
VTGSYAIVAGYDTSVPGYRLFSVNLGDPANPALVTVTPGGGGDIVVRNGLAVASDIIGVAVWDVADPATPVYQGGVGIHYNDQKRIAAVDGYALASNDSYGVTVVDLADPTVPTIVAEVGVPGKAMEADATDELLVIAAEIRGLRFVDVADPAQPVELGILDVPMIPMDAAVEGDLAYATGYGGTGFVVVDISDPGSAAVIGSIPGLWGGDAIEVRDGHAYVACGDPGLRIIDVSVPSAPVEVSSLVLPAGTPPFGTMDVAGGVAVLWPGDEVVYVVDVSDPAAPFIASTIDTNYALHGGVSLKGSWLFIGDALLRIFDLRNPSAPVEKQPYVPVGSGGFLPIVETAGSVAYLASTWQPDSPGIEAVNVGDPTSPALMGASAETFALSGFAFSRWAVHAVSEFSGFDTFAPCQGPLFADDFESGNTTAWSSTVP